ncbi:MAG: hypothetical protein IJU62_03165 [Muribaculaceae bacterium]|nr:hypothetical protein [Muribaculaceae bacterium]
MGTDNKTQQASSESRVVKEQNANTCNRLIGWCILFAVVDVLLFLLLLLLPDCCDDNSSSGLQPSPIISQPTPHDTITVTQPMDTLPDDDMDQRVRDLGGSTNGVMRFTIEWNHDDNDIESDVDAHVLLPNQEEIFFKHLNASTGARLDVDRRKTPGIKIENVIWPTVESVKDGKYVFFVHQFSGENVGVINAKIIIGDKVTSFRINGPLQNDSVIPIAEAEFSNGTLTAFNCNTSILVSNNQ